MFNLRLYLAAAVAASLLSPIGPSPVKSAPAVPVKKAMTPCLIPVVGMSMTHAWDGNEPAQACDVWRFELPAMTSPPAKRRSELWWAVGGKPLSYKEGRPLLFEADVTADLGAAAKSDHDWHVFWQLHGPTRSGEWREPVMVLAVRNGMLHLQGGNGHPAHRSGVNSYWWCRPLASFENGRSYHVRIEAVVSSDVSRGWVTASVDSVKVLNKWQPVSAAGRRPGTMYPNQSVVYSRSGLYRGTDAGYRRPAYRQGSTQKDVVLG